MQKKILKISRLIELLQKQMQLTAQEKSVIDSRILMIDKKIAQLDVEHEEEIALLSKMGMHYDYLNFYGAYKKQKDYYLSQQKLLQKEQEYLVNKLKTQNHKKEQYNNIMQNLATQVKYANDRLIQGMADELVAITHYVRDSGAC